jgi:uncharacterized protein (DUF1330 family)
MVYLVVTIKAVKDREAFQQYADQVKALIAKYQGRYLVSERAPEVREGEFPYARIVIVEFPSADAARSWYDSAEYQAIIPLRRRAFDADIIVARDFTSTLAEGSRGSRVGLG